jgi:hypothetical protein
VLRDGSNLPVNVGDEQLNLEAQPWALISRLAPEREAALVKSITTSLDDLSLIGAPRIKGDTVWPAISQLLTWGFTRSSPALAWRSLHRNTFAAHAIVFPDIWFSIWSGPDAVYCQESRTPGATWASEVTPMTDFPVMNANPHAMALLGLLRVCGIEPAPAGDGLLIAPQDPPGCFVLDLPLLRLEVVPNCISGEYRALIDGQLVLHVRVPKTAIEIVATVEGRPIKNLQDAREVALPITLKAGQAVPFEVSWKPPE